MLCEVGLSCILVVNVNNNCTSGDRLRRHCRRAGEKEESETSYG